MSRDTYPIDIHDPIELNRYVYTANKPVNAVDPSGLAATLNLGIQKKTITAPSIASLGRLGWRVFIGTAIVWFVVYVSTNPNIEDDDFDDDSSGPQSNRDRQQDRQREKGKQEESGEHSKEKRQIDSVARLKGIENRRGFGRYIEDWKERQDGMSGATVLTREQIKKIADEYLEDILKKSDFEVLQ